MFSKATVCLILLLITSISRAEFSLDIDTSTVVHKEIPAIKHYLSELEKRLPARIKNSINEKITVSFVSSQQLPVSLSDKGKVWGWTKKESFFQAHSEINRIYLNQELLKYIRATDHDTKTDKGLIQSLNHKKSKAVLIHELAHIFDYRQGLSLEQRNKLAHCHSLHINMTHYQQSISSDNACDKLIQNQYSISDNPHFLSLAGWDLHGIIFKTRSQLNLSSGFNSPDPYELSNAKEFFAVNLEYFLLDPEYQCRKPALYRYYSSLLSVKPFDTERCEMLTTIPVSSEAWSLNKLRTLDIDPKRLYQIHYLFAGEGDALMSRWGHAMFRLVMCAPKRTEVGPECLKDIAHHVVISFRASAVDFAINYFDGLLGGYPSLLFIMTMPAVINEYSKGELRKIESIPLLLNDEQKLRFIYSVLEQYWSYSGDYYFITNNCATEALKLTKIAHYNDINFQQQTVFTPLGLRDILIDKGLADLSVFNNEKSAIQQGYLFPSSKQKLQSSLNYIANKLHINPMSLENFSTNISAIDRQKMIQSANNNYSGAELRQLLAQFAQLESYLAIVQIANYSKTVGKMVMEQDPRINSKKFTDLVEKFIHIKQSVIANRYTVNSKYGVPLNNEIEPVSAQKMTEANIEIKAISNKIHLWIARFFSQEANEMRVSAANEKLIIELMAHTF